MTASVTLVTAFEPFAGLDRNPSAEVAAALDGRVVAGAPVVTRLLPVSLATYRAAVADAVETVKPSLVIALGLAQTAAVIRVERVGVNRADFSIPDNDGVQVVGRPVEEGAPEVRLATIPVEAIAARLLEAGIPAHVSDSAGAYLCNACLFSLVGMLPAGVPCGFIHLPYLPEQAAAAMAAGEGAVASMALAPMVRAVELAIEVSRQAGT